MPATFSIDADAAAVVIAGPTASGKSALGLALSEALGGVIVNADSQQRYRDLPILTAQPSADETVRAPHRLFGDLAPDQSGSAAEWAMKAADELRAAQGLPILVGGTGLYLRALIDGLADIPKIPAEVRKRAQERLRTEGNRAFHAALIARDPASVRLNAGDTQRILRAYEVVEATGVPLAVWQARASAPPVRARYFKIVLMPERADLYAACDGRFLTMIERGALGEVKALMDRGVPRDAPIMKVLGAAPLAAHLSGEIGRDEAVARAQAATRHYAKRQVTWFRHQFQPDLSLAPGDISGLAAQALPLVRSFAAGRVVDKS